MRTTLLLVLSLILAVAHASPTLLQKSQMQRLQIESQAKIIVSCWTASTQQKCDKKQKCCRGYASKKAICREECQKGEKTVQWQTGEPPVAHVVPYGLDFSFEDRDGEKVTLRVGPVLGAGGNAVVFQCCRKEGSTCANVRRDFRLACRVEFPPQPTSDMTGEFETMRLIQSRVPTKYQELFARPAWEVPPMGKSPCYDVISDTGIIPSPKYDKKKTGCPWGIMHMSGERFNLEQCFFEHEGLMTIAKFREIITSAILALVVLHESHFAHRDAQPKNLMTTNCAGPVAWVDIGGANDLNKVSDPAQILLETSRDFRTLLGGNEDGDCPSCGGLELANYARQLSAANKDKEKIIALAKALDDAARAGKDKHMSERILLLESVLGDGSLRVD